MRAKTGTSVKEKLRRQQIATREKMLKWAMYGRKTVVCSVKGLVLLMWRGRLCVPVYKEDF